MKDVPFVEDEGVCIGTNILQPYVHRRARAFKVHGHKDEVIPPVKRSQLLAHRSHTAAVEDGVVHHQHALPRPAAICVVCHPSPARRLCAIAERIDIRARHVQPLSKGNGCKHTATRHAQHEVHIVRHFVELRAERPHKVGKGDVLHTAFVHLPVRGSRTA